MGVLALVAVSAPWPSVSQGQEDPTVAVGAATAALSQFYHTGEYGAPLKHARKILPKAKRGIGRAYSDDLASVPDLLIFQKTARLKSRI